jgi:Ca2+/H+ antiporter, TMEM165/GDT1 family
MRLHYRHTPLLILLIPSLAGAALATRAPVGSISEKDPAGGSAAFPPVESPGAVSSQKTKFSTGTKDAPVDGKDGRPHEGPFVEVENLRKGDGAGLGLSSSPGVSSKDIPKLKDRPDDPTVLDGVKIPESNDGVMDDKHRQQPKEGTTGTSGGVTEKDKARKAQEGKTGEKAEKIPETPKEAPPLPHSEQQKIPGADEKETKVKDKADEKKKKTDGIISDAAGLEVCAQSARTAGKSPFPPISVTKHFPLLCAETQRSPRPDPRPNASATELCQQRPPRPVYRLVQILYRQATQDMGRLCD